MTAKKTAKKTSKSVEKRVEAQKAEAVTPEVVKAPKEDKESPFVALEARIKALEAKQTIIIDSYAFISAQITGLYGMGGLGAVFDAISEKLSGK